MHLEYDWTKREIERAQSEVTQMKAVLILLENNTLGCEIHIAGMKVGISDNSKLIPIIKSEMKEVQKFIKGEPNTYE